jgi:protocatechuate 3,4-dioxygenase beta subunit
MLTFKTSNTIQDMKQMVTMAFCLLASANIFGQAKTVTQKTVTTQQSVATQKSVTTPKTVTSQTVASTQHVTTAKRTIISRNGPAVGGFILDERKHPINDARAYIYAADSSIIASGYTDASGRYETNPVAPGKYTVKIVYPTAKCIVVSGVIIKNGVAPLSLSMAEPTSDTSLPYTYFVPAALKKSAPKKK